MPAKALKHSIAAFAVCLALAGGHCAEAGPRVEVRLASGRSFVAEIDQRTDGHRLWLRFSGDSATILRPVDWTRVNSAVVQGEELSGAEFRERAAQLKALPEGKALPEEVEPLAEAAAGRATFAERARHALADVPAAGVQSIRAEAFIANWDGDVEADGLVVSLAVFGRGGPVCVDGTLEVEWLGATTDGLDTPRRRARWSRATRREDFGPAGAVFLLPFQATHPEFDLRQAAVGMVRVRFSAPGYGTFEQTLSDVRVRPYSAQRDRIQQRTKQRFLPLERKGRTR